MSWNSMGEFFAMGGYALYVWGSYGMTIVLVVMELISLRARRGRAMDELRRTRGAMSGTGL
jgi:heme exporter protein D